MKLTGSARIFHGLGVAALLYHIGGVVLGGGARDGVQGWAALAVWGFFAVMLITRPATWSLGMGILLLVVVMIQTGLLWLAVSHGKADPNWLNFAASELPYLVGGVCCVRLWFLLRKPKAGAN